MIHCLIVFPKHHPDPRSAGLLASAHALGLTRVRDLACRDVYFIEGDLTEADKTRLAADVLSDPVTQHAEWREAAPAPISGSVTSQLQDALRRWSLVVGMKQSRSALRGPSAVIEVALRPGVTDPVAEQMVRAAHMLGITGVRQAATGQRYRVFGQLKASDLHTLAQRLLANDVIQRYTLGDIEPHFPQDAHASGQVDVIPVRALTAEGLLALSQSRRAALDLAEMQAIQHYYQSEGRDPTDVEFEMIAQTWSEHCVHKTFKARIAVTGNGAYEVNGLLKTYIRAATEKIGAPWVRSAFVDNAGIIDFDDNHEVSFKVETHNHPSAIEPFGGANTGVGGVIRDVLGVSAKPIAATDVLCFGPQNLPPSRLPAGVLHPRRISAGVVAGIQDYGNKIGLPTVNGAIVYDPGYTANPLVFCGCVGLAPKNKHPRGAQPGDRVVVLGGRTGRDGLRGATFSSMTMDAQTGEVAGASVQIGDPITEKGLIEVITRARDEGLYTAITDCGAGGLSSAVGEMSSALGGEVQLRAVRLKYPGLAPWEIWLSEAQERMVLAVPAAHLPRLHSLCALFDMELTDIGAFNTSGRLVVRDGDKVVLTLDNHFLHEGIPQRHLPASVPAAFTRPAAPPPNVADFNATTLALLAHPNIASKAAVIRLYDHEVQGGTVVKPLTGVHHDAPSDACVIKPAGTRGQTALALSNGLNPFFGMADAYRMALSVVDEAIRNAVAVGANPDRMAILDNFCWGDPKRPETLGALVEAARGCHDAALHYGTPFISGKDSLNNEYLGADGQRHAIPPTLLISAIGLVPDVTRVVTMDLKASGNLLYLLGETLPEFGGAHLHQVLPKAAPARHAVPGLPAHAPALYRALHRAMLAGLVRACHDLSEGGLAVALAEMCLGGRLGAAVTVPTPDPVTALFSESNGRLLCEVRPAEAAAFEAALAGLPCTRIGLVTATHRLEMSTRTRALVSLPLERIAAAWLTQTVTHD